MTVRLSGGAEGPLEESLRLGSVLSSAADSAPPVVPRPLGDASPPGVWSFLLACMSRLPLPSALCRAARPLEVDVLPPAPPRVVVRQEQALALELQGSHRHLQGLPVLLVGGRLRALPALA